MAKTGDLLLVVFGLFQFGFGIVDQAIQKVSDTFWTESLPFGKPQWSQYRSWPSLKTLV